MNRTFTTQRATFSSGFVAGIVFALALFTTAPARSQALAPPMPQGQNIDLPGVHLWVIDSGGDGTPVVMLHADTGTSESWRFQYAPLINAGYRVIAFDRRGRGKSTPDTATGVQPGSVGEDLDALVEHLHLKPFHLIGVAGGGFVALDYAAWRPQRLRSLVIGASTGAVKEPPVQQAIDRIEIPEIRKQPASYRELGPSYRAINPEGVKEWLDIEHRAASQPGVKSQPMRTPNTFAKIETIKAATLVIAPGADLLAPPTLMKLWADHVPNHEWAMIPESGHSIAWEKPAQFNGLMLDFLARH